MPLLVYQIPECRNQVNAARIRFEQFYQLKRYKLEEYITFSEALKIYPKKGLFKTLINTNSFYGFKIKNKEEIYLHPGVFYEYLKKYYKRQINKVLKENLKIEVDTSKIKIAIH